MQLTLLYILFVIVIGKRLSQEIWCECKTVIVNKVGDIFRTIFIAWPMRHGTKESDLDFDYEF